MELSIIILSYKSKRLVKNCIRAIQESSLSISHEIIVVDNNSGDGIEDMMAEHYPQIKLIVTTNNLGMGGGNNAGIRAAHGKYVLVMNPDIFVSPGAIEKMYNHMIANRKIGILAPRLLNPDKSLQHTCYRWHQPLTPLYRRTFLGRLPGAQKAMDHFLMKDFDHQTTKDVHWCQGSCMMMKKEVLDQVGHFDDSFFMYFEDTDLCRRMWLAGYSVTYFPSAEVIHMHMRMSGGGLIKVLTNKLTREHIKSWIRYSWKHRKSPKPDLASS